MSAGRSVDTGRALTVRRPWPSAILDHGRRVDVRKRPPPAAQVGRRFWVHVGRAFGRPQLGDTALLEGRGLPVADDLPGCIVGRARLVGWVRMQGTAGQRVVAGGLMAGAGWPAVEPRWLTELLPRRFQRPEVHLWLLDDAERCPPVGPAIGQLGFWSVGDALHHEALDAIASARRGRIAAALDELAWDLGEPRREPGGAVVLGRDERGVRLRVCPSGMTYDVCAGARWRRGSGFTTAEALVAAMRTDVAAVRACDGDAGSR